MIQKKVIRSIENGKWFLTMQGNRNPQYTIVTTEVSKIDFLKGCDKFTGTLCSTGWKEISQFNLLHVLSSPANIIDKSGWERYVNEPHQSCISTGFY